MRAISISLSLSVSHLTANPLYVLWISMALLHRLLMPRKYSSTLLMALRICSLFLAR